MADKIWEASEVDINLAAGGVRLQAELAGLDVNDENVAKFLKQQINLVATLNAEVRFIRNIMNKELNQ